MDNKSTIQDPKTGNLLIAQPFMQDDFFKKSVILIADYHKTGTVGFMLNRPLRMNIKSIISDFPEFPSSVFLGGPVDKDTVHYLHTAGDILDGSKEVLPGVYWGGNFHQLKFLISNKVIGPHDIRFFLGYSGWSPGQLKEEMEETSTWMLTDGDPNYIFHRENVDVWRQIVSDKSNNFSLLASINEELNFN